MPDSIVKDCWQACLMACCCICKVEIFRSCALFTVFIVILLSIGLQSTGIFTPHWGHNSTCSEIGLIKTTCVNSTVIGVDAFDRSIFGLQAGSYALLMCTGLWNVYVCIRCRDINDAIGRFCFPCCVPLFAFFSGLLNFGSCMGATGKLQEKEYSFYMCLSASCLIGLTSVFFMGGYIVHKRCNWCC